MPRKGHTNNPNGRPKGVPNKNTAELRENLRKLVEFNQKKMQKWLDKVGEKDPAKAISLINDMSEYVLPKLSRAEVVAEVINEYEIDLTSLDDATLDKLIGKAKNAKAE